MHKTSMEYISENETVYDGVLIFKFVLFRVVVLFHVVTKFM